MKSIFLAAPLSSDFLAGNVEAQHRPTLAFYQLISQNERDILIQNCHQIRTQIAAQFSGMGAKRSNAYQNTVKQEITNYLQSVRTPTAL